jgi:hypothetical protein
VSSYNFSTDAGISPTSKPPEKAPMTAPTPIGATVFFKEERSLNAPRLAYLTNPTNTVGKLTSRLAVPAVLISAPKAKILNT